MHECRTFNGTVFLPGYSGADMRCLCQETAFEPLRALGERLAVVPADEVRLLFMILIVPLNRIITYSTVCVTVSLHLTLWPDIDFCVCVLFRFARSFGLISTSR